VNVKEREKHRKELMKLVGRLRGELAQIRDVALRAGGTHASMANVDAVPGDSADMSADQLQHDIAISVHENERLILDLADRALERIGDGSYGRCVECGQPISAQRLNAIPYTPHCVRCARHIEGQAETEVGADVR
jgi:RNA polymerase-binding protein DksA